MTTSNIIVLIVSAAIWIATFPLAWMLLARLVAIVNSADKPHQVARFWSLFVVYQIIIIAPYVVVLMFGHDLSHFLNDFLFGLIAVSIILSTLRFIGKSKTVAALWWVYGLVYDGLNYFYPYIKLKARVVDNVTPKSVMRVLDLGCGTGNVLVDILAKDSTVNAVGVDNSKTMLFQARRKLKNRSNVTLVRADILDYLATVSDATFDQVIMLNVVYAVSDRSKLWSETLRVLKPNGSIVATTSDRSGSKAIIKEHIEHASKWSLLHPTLLLVGVIDYFISEMARSDVFTFLTANKLEQEISQAGGKMSKVERCYGGPVDGVNLLFDVTHA